MRIGKFLVRPHHLVITGLILILLFDCAIRWRLREMPLERDEGEYAYAGQLLLQGDSPYKHAYNVTLKFPGTCGAYALIFAAFGQTAAAIHAGLILVNVISAWLVFILARRISGASGGLVTAGTFVLLSMSPATLGFAAHATHFVMLPALAGIVLLQNPIGITPHRLVTAGILLGLALLMKQTAAPFLVFSCLWVVWCERFEPVRKWRLAFKRLAWLGAGIVLPITLTGIFLAASGDLSQLWLWTFRYAALHGTVLHWNTGIIWMFHCLSDQFLSAPLLWSVSICGIVFLFTSATIKSTRMFVGGLAIFSFLAVCPGWYFRGHYFIQLIPVAAILSGIAIRGIESLLSRFKFRIAPLAISLSLFGAAMVSTVIQWNDIYFWLTPTQVCRAIYGTNPFPEAQTVGEYLFNKCPPEARIAVIGSEPEIYFYSQRRSASGYICTYPLVEPQPFASMMRDQMIREIESAEPVFFVFVNVPGSWRQSTAPLNSGVFEWFENYRTKNLQLIGYVEQLPNHEVTYHWFDSKESFPPPTEYSLAVFRRK